MSFPHLAVPFRSPHPLNCAELLEILYSESPLLSPSVVFILNSNLDFKVNWLKPSDLKHKGENRIEEPKDNPKGINFNLFLSVLILWGLPSPTLMSLLGCAAGASGSVSLQQLLSLGTFFPIWNTSHLQRLSYYFLFNSLQLFCTSLNTYSLFLPEIQS